MPPDDSTGIPAADGPTWSDAELNEWFENDFGGSAAFNDFYYDDGGFRLTAEDNADLHFGMTAYRELAYDTQHEMQDEAEPWRLLGPEAKSRFRRGWEDTQAKTESIMDELAPYDAMKTLVDARHKLEPPRPPRPRWILLGGGIGILGLVLAGSFFLGGGDADGEAVGLSSAPSAETTTPPSTTAALDDADTPATGVDAPDLSGVPFPTRWSYIATKVADLVPPPEFITPAGIGTDLRWAFDVIDTCNEDSCTYATVLQPLMANSILGEVPKVIWDVDGAEWSLDVTYQTVQSQYSDGTICVIHNREVFELTITDEAPSDRLAPIEFVGTWVQTTSLDLAESTGNLDLYCGEGWETIEEWLLAGATGN